LSDRASEVAGVVQLEPDGAILWLRLTPRGGRDALEGVEPLADGRKVLKARVRAVAEDGRANEALIELLAKALHVPRSSVSILAGHTARLKKLFIAGDPARFIDALAKALAPNNG
jgi:hypothetical protein